MVRLEMSPPQLCLSGRLGLRLYEKLEAEGKGRKTIKAQHLWFRILEAQMETGEAGSGPFGPGLDLACHRNLGWFNQAKNDARWGIL